MLPYGNSDIKTPIKTIFTSYFIIAGTKQPNGDFMKKIRRRLTLILVLTIIISSTATVVLTCLMQGGTFFSRKEIPVLFYVYAFKDMLLFALTILLLLCFVFTISKRTSTPIVELSNAAKELARGNFDVHIEESGRKDELGDLEKQFNVMIRELRSNEYLKKDFISNVSHEFKTPLSLINGYGKLLTEPDLTPEERQEYAELIVQQSSHLSELTSNILKLSKLNNDTIQVNRTPFALDEQIRQTILFLQPKWDSKQIRFHLHLPTAIYQGDASLLREIWLNILDNAIKFSPENGLIDLSLLSTTYTYVIYIRDQGPGMDKETRAHIFEQFYQGDTSHKKEGTGLGLSIALKIAQLHGGKIDCTSTPGKGTTFTVYLRK